MKCSGVPILIVSADWSKFLRTIQADIFQDYASSGELWDIFTPWDKMTGEIGENKIPNVEYHFQEPRAKG